MKKVAIVTDSSAYLPKAFVDQYQISVVPLTLNWDGKSYYDGVDIQAEAFYTRLSKSSSIPTTSQVTVQQFVDVYRKLLDAGHDVISLNLSSGISGTVESAMIAQEQFPGAPLLVVDTKLVAMALSLMVLAVARAAEAGADLKACKAVADEVFPKIGVYFTVDTLTYLHKGGRINSAKRLMGSALNLKPLMEIREGKIELVESVVSRKKAIARMLDLVEKRIAGASPVRVAPFHALALDEALQLQKAAQERFNPVENILSEVSPVIGTHTGPGTLSIAFQAG